MQIADSVELLCQNIDPPATVEQTRTAAGTYVAPADVACDNLQRQPASNLPADIFYIQQLLSEVIGAVDTPTALNQTACTVVAEHSDDVINVRPIIQTALFYGSRTQKPTAPYSPSHDVGKKLRKTC